MFRLIRRFGIAGRIQLIAPPQQLMDTYQCQGKQPGREGKQIHHSQRDCEQCSQSGTGHRSGTAACRNESEQPICLFAGENICHEAPEHRDHKHVEHTRPDHECMRENGRSAECPKEKEKDEDVRNKEHINTREDFPQLVPGRHCPEDRHNQQHHHKCSREHPLEMLHTPGNPHLIPEGPENIIAAQQAEKIQEGPD